MSAPVDPTHRVSLPRFLVREPVGLGQLTKQVTRAVGLTPCRSCEERAARMDRWVRIEPKR